MRSRELDALGMVIDFADLKKIVAAVVDPFDHQYLNDIPPFTERNTTAELLSQYIFEEIGKRLPAGRELTKVEIWETDSSCAIYEAG